MIYLVGLIGAALEAVKSMNAVSLFRLIFLTRLRNVSTIPEPINIPSARRSGSLFACDIGGPVRAFPILEKASQV